MFGKMAEILIWNRTLSTVERNNVQNYLSSRYSAAVACNDGNPATTDAWNAATGKCEFK